MFGYIIALKELKNNEYVFHKIITYFLYATLILSISIIAAMATGTDFQSYPNSKIGSRGWFFAGNDLSSIFAIMFPIVVLYSVHKTTSFSKVYYWIPTVLAMYASIMIGTKVGYGAIVITPQTPIAKNMSIHLQIYEYKKSVQDEKDRKEGKVVKEEEHKQGELKDSEMKSLIYSDRDKFLKVYKQYYKEAPLSQNLFGMGYAGNYTTNMKLVEMDFYDLFFAFGIVGFLMYVLPLLYFGIKIFIRLITNFRKLFSVKHTLLASTLVLSLGIGFMSGHVLTAPAVSIFFVVILAYLIVDLEIE